MNRELNWAGNLEYGAARLHHPESIEGLQEIVARARHVKALGTRHSFNNIADTDADLVCLDRLPPVFDLDRERFRVTIDAGARYGRVARALHSHGFALPNLASLPHISVAGACATATHGSGDRNGCLATSVCGLEMVTANGDLARFSREQDADLFDGVVVALGALGVVTTLTLEVIPGFEVRQDVYTDLPVTALETCFDEIMSSAYSVSLFTNWRGDSVGQVWLKSARESDPGPSLFGAVRASDGIHPIVEMSAENCTAQMGVPGPWHERLPHFRMEFTPSCGEELQSEYLVPRTTAVEALRTVREIGDQIAPILLISEIRSIAADHLWLSPFHDRDSIAIHFTWRKNCPAVEALLPKTEEALAPFDARPHWGKLFTMQPNRIRALYPRMDDFRRLMRSMDPDGKFRNAFLDRYIVLPE